MGSKEAEQAGALREVREPDAVIVAEPAIESTLVATLEGKEQGKSDQLTGIEERVGMFGQVAEHAVNSNEETNATIVGSHANLRS